MCVFPEAQRLDRREGSSDVTVLARWRGAGGVLDFGMFATGGPVTWEILSLCARVKRDGARLNRKTPSKRKPTPSGSGWRRGTAERRCPLGDPPHSRPKARGTGAKADGEQEVGGPNKSDEGRGRLATTRRSKGGPC